MIFVRRTRESENCIKASASHLHRCTYYGTMSFFVVVCQRVSRVMQPPRGTGIRLSGVSSLPLRHARFFGGSRYPPYTECLFREQTF